MSVAGIATSILSTLNNSQSQSRESRFQQITSEFKQLGQDLQAGNLSGAQQDFTTLSQLVPALAQTSASTTAAAGASGSSQTRTTPLLQEFAQLGQDLQSGNLQSAQQDYTNIQQTALQNSQSAAQQSGGHHHHHHHVESSQDSSSSSSSQQTNPISQAFSTLSQDLQAGNLQGAQQAFATLQNDLQQIGGFTAAGSNGTGSAGFAPAGGSLNVTA